MKTVALAGLAAALIAATGCVSQGEFDAVVMERDQIRNDLVKSQDQIKSLESDLSNSNEQVESATKKIAELARESQEFASTKAKLDARITTLTEDVGAAEERARKAELAALENDAKTKNAEALISALRAMKSQASANMAAVKVEGEKTQRQIQNLVKAVLALDEVLAKNEPATATSTTGTTSAPLPETGAAAGVD